MANGQKPDPEAYRQALVRSRGALQALNEETRTSIVRATTAFHLGLERNLQRALGDVSIQGLGDPRALDRATEIVQRLAGDLQREFEQLVAANRRVTYETLQDAWRKAGAEAAASVGIEGAALGAVRLPPVELFGAYDAIGAAENWRTLLRGHVENAAREANEIVRLGMAEGVGPDELARRLRKYVLGAEDFQDLFEDMPTLTGDVAKLDLRTLGANLRGQAKQMVHNARRIAFSEYQNARMEAEVQSMFSDPLVKAIRWKLSPNRGVSFTPPDQCDVLAEQDFYGMGPGVYPIASVPQAPHPWDRCDQEAVTRSTSEMEKPKPTPSRRRSATRVKVPRSEGLTENRLQHIRDQTEKALQRGEQAFEEFKRRRAA